jgi:NADH:quinone reductase (non-electrogenic)
VSRYYAIGHLRSARVWGFVGWLIWLVVHLTFLTGFKNRVGALFHWTISFFGRSRAERTITAQQIFARQALAASVRAVSSMSELAASRRRLIFGALLLVLFIASLDQTIG